VSVELLERTAQASVAGSETVTLFPTQVKVLHWQTEPGFNERLTGLCMELFARQVCGRLKYYEYNLWNDERPELLELRRMFEAGMGAYVDEFMSPRIKKAYDFEMHAWLRVDRPKDIIPPHAHIDVNLVATYYPLAEMARPESEGRLMLLDPRPGVRLFMEKSREGTHAIEPQAGMMVIIPSYLHHWVEPFSEGDRRLCIANNMTLVRKIRRDVPGRFEGVR